MQLDNELAISMIWMQLWSIPWAGEKRNYNRWGVGKDTKNCMGMVNVGGQTQQLTVVVYIRLQLQNM